MSSLRLVLVSWWLQFKMIMRSPFDGIGNVIYPLFFATVAFFVFRAGHSPRTLVYASFGAAVMGMWSSVSTSAGSAMQRERWWGTLELLVVQTEPEVELTQAILSHLNGSDVGRISRREPTLEDAYVALVSE